MKKMIFAAAIPIAVAAPHALAQHEMLEGWYLRGSGMYVDQRSAGVGDTLFGVGGDVSFDPGFGFTVGVGHRFGEIAFPISAELEGSYRRAGLRTFSSTGGDANLSGSMWSLALMVNGVFDIDLPNSPFGLYGGGGIGAAYIEGKINDVGGVPVNVRDDAVTFAYQVMAGVTLRVAESAQLYGGARWFDAGRPSFEGLRVRHQSIGAELGIRFFF